MFQNNLNIQKKNNLNILRTVRSLFEYSENILNIKQLLKTIFNIPKTI